MDTALFIFIRFLYHEFWMAHLAMDFIFYHYRLNHRSNQQFVIKELDQPHSSLSQYYIVRSNSRAGSVLSRQRQFYFITCNQPFWISHFHFFHHAHLLQKLGIPLFCVGRHYQLRASVCWHSLPARCDRRRRFRLGNWFAYIFYFQQPDWFATIAQRTKSFCLIKRANVQSKFDEEFCRPL